MRRETMVVKGVAEGEIKAAYVGGCKKSKNIGTIDSAEPSES